MANNASNFLSNLLMGMAKPAINTGKRIGGAGYELNRAKNMTAADLFSKLGMNDLAQKNLQQASNTNPFLQTESDISAATSPLQMAKDSAGLLAYAIPGGVGKQAITRGAAGGAISGFGASGGENLQTILGDTALGALTGGVTGGVLNKVFGAKAAQEATKAKPNAFQKILDDIGEGGANKFTKASPSVYKKVSQAGFDLNKTIPKYVGKGGTTYEALLGLPDEAGKGGSLNAALNTAETKLQSAIANKGDMIVATQDDLLAPIMARKTKLSKLAGEKSKVEKIDEFANEIKALYPNGVNARQALDVKRAMDARFGQSVISDETATITSDLQKMMANTLRGKLKGAIPEVADALDTQSEILTIRPVIEHARSVSKTQGSTIRRGSLSGVEIQRPMSLLEPILGSQKVSSAMSKLQSGAGQGMTQAVPEQAAKMSPNIMQLLSGAVMPSAAVNAGVPVEGASSGMANAAETMPRLTQEEIQASNRRYQFPGTEQQAQGGNSQELQQVITQLMVIDPKNADMYKSILQMQGGGAAINPDEGLTEPQRVNRERSRTAIRALDSLEAEVLKPDGTVDNSKLVKASLPGSLGARSYRSNWGSIIDIIGSNRTGASYTPEQRNDYKHLLPIVGDSPEVVQQKLATLRQELDAYAGNGSPATVSSGQDVLQQLLMSGGY